MKEGLFDKIIWKVNNPKHSQNINVLNYMGQFFHLAHTYYSLKYYLHCELAKYSNT